ncbi:rCG21812, partial [Rattus norvegicus]
MHIPVELQSADNGVSFLLIPCMCSCLSRTTITCAASLASPVLHFIQHLTNYKAIVLSQRLLLAT